VVLQGGRIQEQGPVKELLASPTSAYTRRLLSDAPSLAKPRPERRASTETDLAIVVEGLTQDFPVAGSAPFRALDGVSFEVQRGTTHAIVGESGSGKTTAVRSVVGFLKPTAGRILVDGVDLTTLKGEALRRFRKHIQLVYQNPYGSLDPKQTVFRIVEEPLLNFEPIPAADRARKVRDMMRRVGLTEAFLERHPRALSGGQRQRVAIARALVLDPRVLVLDEAVSALDVTVQAQILALLDELQKALGLTYLFVSHDLAVVKQISDTVSVMHKGRQVDGGPIDRVFMRPDSSYTRELIDAIPGRAMPVLASPAISLQG
jgi:peptide/nickel transport system ATP-binding protein